MSDVGNRYKKIVELLSCLTGQIDKRISNFVYKYGPIYRYRSKRRKNRYENKSLYFVSRALVCGVLILTGTLTAPTYAIALGLLGGGVTVIKTLSMIVNPNGKTIEREKIIRKGSYIENIRGALLDFEKKKEKINTSNEKSITKKIDESEKLVESKKIFDFSNFDIKNALELTKIVNSINSSNPDISLVHECYSKYMSLTDQERNLVSQDVRDKLMALFHQVKQKGGNKQGIFSSDDFESYGKVQQLLRKINSIDLSNPDINLVHECYNRYISLSEEEKKTIDPIVIEKFEKLLGRFNMSIEKDKKDVFVDNNKIQELINKVNSVDLVNINVNLVNDCCVLYSSLSYKEKELLSQEVSDKLLKIYDKLADIKRDPNATISETTIIEKLTRIVNSIDIDYINQDSIVLINEGMALYKALSTEAKKSVGEEIIEKLHRAGQAGSEWALNKNMLIIQKLTAKIFDMYDENGTIVRKEVCCRIQTESGNLDIRIPLEELMPTDISSLDSNLPKDYVRACVREALKRRYNLSFEPSVSYRTASISIKEDSARKM